MHNFKDEDHLSALSYSHPNFICEMAFSNGKSIDNVDEECCAKFLDLKGLWGYWFDYSSRLVISVSITTLVSYPLLIVTASADKLALD